MFILYVSNNVQQYRKCRPAITNWGLQQQHAPLRGGLLCSPLRGRPAGEPLGSALLSNPAAGGCRIGIASLPCAACRYAQVVVSNWLGNPNNCPKQQVHIKEQKSIRR